MNAPTAAPGLTADLPGGVRSWLEHGRSNGRLLRLAELVTAASLVAVLTATYFILGREAAPGTLLSPTLIAVLLIANLLPAIVLLVLLSRRLALAHAARGGLGGARLHTRLVALFSAIAAVPTVLVAIFASLLFQSGLEFWFSDRARGMLENTVALARSNYDGEIERVSKETATMSGDLASYLSEVPIDSPRFAEGFARQVYYRNLSEAAVVNVPADGKVQTLALVNPYDRPFDRVVTREAVAALANKSSVALNSPDRVGALVPLAFGRNTYVYAARIFDPKVKAQIDRAGEVLEDYQALLVRSRINQLRFNGALLGGALLIVGIAIFFALTIADRLVRPVGRLVSAAGRVEAGDLSARVPVSPSDDELGLLATAFNRMTGRLQEQTGALIAANNQLETRSAFIEAVLSSVTAGVIALDADRRVLLINRSAETLLGPDGAGLEGAELSTLSPDLDEFLSGDRREANVTISAGVGQRTLAVKRMRYQDGFVLTFDDITDQLSDQRRAAWSDIAQRIAHEIKNPLTPIQLAAERLQRRYAKEVTSDPDTFTRLTETIVRQVGDLRRMVDEFSSFARMPKPVFRHANIHDVARAALFLHEVAHPGISFTLDPPAADMPLVCDRRQLGQAITNIVKNAVEAIEARRKRGEESPSGDRVAVQLARRDNELVIEISDTGVGLPENRERLTEPYMTTRVRGTGLGLAIVKKIVEEHFGEIAFLDRAGGGSQVRITLDAARLSALLDDDAAGGALEQSTDGDDDGE